MSVQTMKAWVAQRYGGPEILTLQDCPLPVPADDEVLVRIHASTVSSGDARVRALNMPPGFKFIGRLALGFTGPRQPILGTDLAGTVHAVGRGVTGFKPGDAVLAFAGVGMRCHAQYRVMRVSKPITHKPSNLSFEESVSLAFGGTTALHFLRKAQLKAGESVLVIGASGAVGCALVQLARQQGAVVTGITSGPNLALVQSLGASIVIDYTVHDFTQSPRTYDLIVDTVAATTFAACNSKLNERGRYVSVTGGLAASLARPIGTKRSIGGPVVEHPADLVELVRLAELGILRPVIDRTYSFTQLPEAHAYVDSGRKRGSVVVSMVQS